VSIQDFDRPSLTDVAYKEIRNGILLGELEPGDKLVVNDLVDKWRISNTPIKEALNRLVAEGLVEALPRRGMRVRLLMAKELREYFEIRTLYEVHCCRKAVERIDDNLPVLEELQVTLEKCHDILDDEFNYLMQFQLDEMFHMLIAGLCGNDTLVKDFDRIHAHILMIGVYANRHAPLRRLPETFAEHSAILERLERRDADGMAEAMRIHLANTAEGLQKLYNPASGRFMCK
jgi:Transcriptional regulators